MEPRTDIDALMAHFAALPGARVGAGPRHPKDPDPALQARVAQLFDEVPSLTRDQGYVDFMWRYAGASRSDAAQVHVFEIFGFSPVATTLDEFEEALVDDKGYFYLAEATHHERQTERLDSYTVGFLFNVDPQREWAVYRNTQGMFAEEQPVTPYRASFVEFLAEVVANGGRFPRLWSA